MPDDHETNEKTQYTTSQRLFLAAPEEHKELLRDILQEEREVMHMLRRPDIHQKIVQLVRRHIA